MPKPNDPSPTDPTRDYKVAQSPAASSARADETVPVPPRAAAPAPRFAPPAQPGEIGTLGPYRVVKELGKGGMGIVYLALDTRLARQVALKVMLPEFAAHAPSRDRFLREARAAAQISHDNVVTVYEAAAIEGVPYIAMQFLRGYPLDEYLKKKGAPTLPQVLKLARETALGLAAAHELGLVHRDIKPANLWLEAPSGRVKILDFGLARPVDPEGDAELTKSGAVVGTPAYMSPEQARGLKVDHRTDLFSLGSVLFRLCTGRLAFEGPNTMAVLLALGTEEPPPVLGLNPQVPPALARLIHQLLAKNPDQRPQTAEQLADRLAAIAERPWIDADDMPTGTAPLPQVVYAPLQVTMGPEISAFDNLDAGDEVEKPRSVAKSKVADRPSAGTGIWLGVGAAVLLAVVVVVGVFLALMKKDTGAKNDPPDSPPPAKKDVRPVRPPAPPVPVDPDRRGAEYVLSIGGVVQVNGVLEDIRREADLPPQPFTLTKIWLRDNRDVTDTGLAACAGCEWVRHLDLVRTTVTDAGLEHFKECKNLLILDLDDAHKIGDRGLSHFDGSTSITSLWLGGTGVTNAGLAYFRDCKNVFQLDVKKTSVTDAGLVHLKGCPNLRQLFISDTTITDVGLANFNDCKQLLLLDAVNSGVSDTGLIPFHNCVALQEVRLSGSRVTARGVADLRTALPQCKVTWIPQPN